MKDAIHDLSSEEHFSRSVSPETLRFLIKALRNPQVTAIAFDGPYAEWYSAVVPKAIRRFDFRARQARIWETDEDARGFLLTHLFTERVMSEILAESENYAHDPCYGSEVVKAFLLRARSAISAEMRKRSPSYITRQKVLDVVRELKGSALIEIQSHVFAPNHPESAEWEAAVGFSCAEASRRFAARDCDEMSEHVPSPIPSPKQIRNFLLNELFPSVRHALSADQMVELVISVFRVSWMAEMETVSPTGEPEGDDETPTGHVPASAPKEVEFPDSAKIVADQLEQVIEFRDRCNIESGEGRFGLYFRSFWLFSTLGEDERNIREYATLRNLRLSAAYELKEQFRAMIHAATVPLVKLHGKAAIQAALKYLRQKWEPYRIHVDDSGINSPAMMAAIG